MNYNYCQCCGKSHDITYNPDAQSTVCDCEVRANERELETLRRKINDYNQCHQFSMASLRYGDAGPYIKVLHV